MSHGTHILSFRSWKLCVILSLVATAVLSAKFYFYPAAFGRQWTPIGFSYLRGYRLGAAQAKKDIEDSRAMILDLSDGPYEESVDRRTGLNMWYMGDVTDRGTAGYVAGYNGTVYTFIEKNGIPSYSWKRWESIIFNAREYFDRRSAEHQFLILRNGVEGPRSPYSNKAIMLRTNNTGIYFICLGSGFSSCNTAWPVSPQNGELKCVWGPDGSNLLFIRGNYCRTNNPVIGVFEITTEIRKLRFEYRRYALPPG